MISIESDASGFGQSLWISENGVNTDAQSDKAGVILAISYAEKVQDQTSEARRLQDEVKSIAFYKVIPTYENTDKYQAFKLSNEAEYGSEKLVGF